MLSDALLPSRCPEGEEGSVLLNPGAGSCVCVNEDERQGKLYLNEKFIVNFYAIQFSGFYIQEVITINSEVVVQSFGTTQKMPLFRIFNITTVLAWDMGCVTVLLEKFWLLNHDS